MSFQMFDGAITVNVDRTPLFLDEATLALYNRAINDPSSLTDAERRTITNRPPPEEEDSLCRAACGLSFSELITKAIQNSDSLTYKEGHLVTAGVVPNQAGRLLDERMRLSPEERDLLHRANAAATTDHLKTAKENARTVNGRRHNAKSAAMKACTNNDLRNIRYALQVPWQQHVLDLTETSVCGLVIYFLEIPETAPFKEEIKTAIYHGLHLYPNLTNDATVDKFTLYWEVYDTDPASLPSQFLSSRNEFPSGLRLDSFLYIDQESLNSRNTPRPFVWLWEPLSETIKPLKVDIKQICPTLYARLIQRDLDTDRAKTWPYRHTSQLEDLHRAASFSRNANWEQDWIWPPPPHYM